MSLEKFPNSFLNFSEQDVKGEEERFYRFKSFRLNVEERRLTRDNFPVPLTPKAFDVLVALIERSGHLVEKDELLRIVWADSFVEEINVARIVHTLRKTLGENENGYKFIETVAKKGYRFVAEVEEVCEPTAPKSTNGKSDFLFAAENSAEAIFEEQSPETIAATKTPQTDFQILPTAADKTVAPPVHNQKRATRIVLFTVGFASAVFLLLLLSFNWQSKSSFDPNEAKSIAVLPLKSLTTEKRDAIYELGVAGSLIFKLGAAKNLVIRPLSATQNYVDAKKDAIAIGKEQQVDFVLASNYQIADGKIRVTSELINVSSGAVEESFRDEQSVSDSFAAQDAITANISKSLLKRLNREPNNLAPKRYTNNDAAYRDYLTGAALTDKRNKKDAEKAVEHLQKAVELDPNYALAYARLANAHSAIAVFGGDNHEEYLKARAAIEKALAIDENQAEAHALLGEMKLSYEWDFDGAERALKKAVALDPNSTVAHRIYALYLNSMGRFDESIAEAKIAIDLEPASVLNHKNYAQFLYFARRYDEAAAQAERTVEMDRNFRVTYGWLINSYKMKGEDDKAFECFLRSPLIAIDNPEKIQMWKEIYAKSGWRGINEQKLQEASDWQKPQLYAELGDKEQAIVSLEKNFSDNQRGWAWTTIKNDPRYDSIRSDPRFEAIVKRIGLK